MLQANGGGVELIYTVDATGAGLGSGAAEILDTCPYRDNIGGVVLTLDSRMQSIAETAMNRIKKGALVLLMCTAERCWRRYLAPHFRTAISLRL